MSAAVSTGRKKRIGVFGGAFDPPHQAHVAIAEAAVLALELDELRIVPTGHAWHKARTLSAPEHRLAMTRLAFAGLPRILVDDRELHRPGPTFTVDTLRALQAEEPQAQLYLIMGADQFESFRQWHEWQAVIQLAIICIADRATSTTANPDFDAYPGLESRLVRLATPLMPVSATQLRQLLVSGALKSGETRGLVSDAIARYISINRLYGPR